MTVRAVYRYPVFILTKTSSYHIDERGKVKIDDVFVNSGTYYLETDFEIEIPFTDLFYAGRIADAPGWAKHATEDDVSNV